MEFGVRVISISVLRTLAPSPAIVGAALSVVGDAALDAKGADPGKGRLHSD